MNLVLTKLTKKYGDFTAVNNVSFSIEPQSVFALLGSNGAGKTSIIRILSGLSKLDSGSISFGEYDFQRHFKEIKQITGIVPQFRNLDLESTVFENLSFHGKLYKTNSDDLNKRINALLARFDLLSKKNVLVKKLSGGIQQKILIIRALVTNPKLLIMDEPSVGLDPQSRLDLWNFIKEIKKDHSILLTTQDMHEADYLSDQIGIINNGKLIRTGTPKQLKENYNDSLTNLFIEVSVYDYPQKFIEDLEHLKNKKVLLDIEHEKDNVKIKSSRKFVNEILAVVNGFKINDIKIYEPSLEKVFINLTQK